MASALYGPAEIPVGARTHCPQKALWKAVQVQRDMRSNTDTGLQESSIVMSMSNITPGDRKINLNTATMFDYSTASKVKIKTLAAYLNLNYFKKRLKTKNHLPKSTFILLVWVFLYQLTWLRSSSRNQAQQAHFSWLFTAQIQGSCSWIYQHWKTHSWWLLHHNTPVQFKKNPLTGTYRGRGFFPC